MRPVSVGNLSLLLSKSWQKVSSGLPSSSNTKWMQSGTHTSTSPANGWLARFLLVPSQQRTKVIIGQMNEAYLAKKKLSSTLFISPHDAEVSIFLLESTSLFIASLGHSSSFPYKRLMLDLPDSIRKAGMHNRTAGKLHKSRWLHFMKVF